MVFECPARPAYTLLVRPFGQRGANRAGRQFFGIEEVEAVGRVQMLLAPGERLHFHFGLVPADFGDGEDPVVSVCQRADPRDESRDVGMRHVVLLELEIERSRARPVGCRSRRIVAQFRVVHCEVQRIDAEAIDPAIKPEPHRCKHGILHLAIVHVHLRLRIQEIVQVVLTAPCIPGPGGATEDRLPVGRRRSIGLGIGPHEPVRFRAGPARPAFDEPRMLVRCMRIDLIDQHPEPKRMRACDKRVEIRQRAEDRIDIAIVCNIVAEVLHWRSEEGRNPDGIDAE